MNATPADYRPFLESERLILRPLIEADVEGAYALWLNDPEVCAQNSHAVFPASKESLRSYVRRTVESKTEVVLAIELRESGQHIGNISLQNIQWIARNAELAILLGAKECWGRGYGLEAARALVEYGFRRLNLHRIYCGTYEGNAGMIRIAEKLGFQREGQRRQAIFKEGVFMDVLEFGLLAEEFERSESNKKL